MPQGNVMRRCPQCLGPKKLTVLKTAIRANGTKVITNHKEEACATCHGEGVVPARRVNSPDLPYMRHNFTDGSVATMDRAGDPWQVRTGRGGKPPQARTSATLDCEARAFATHQNQLRIEKAFAS